MFAAALAASSLVPGAAASARSSDIDTFASASESKPTDRSSRGDAELRRAALLAATRQEKQGRPRSQAGRTLSATRPRFRTVTPTSPPSLARTQRSRSRCGTPWCARRTPSQLPTGTRGSRPSSGPSTSTSTTRTTTTCSMTASRPASRSTCITSRAAISPRLAKAAPAGTATTGGHSRRTASAVPGHSACRHTCFGTRRRSPRRASVLAITRPMLASHRQSSEPTHRRRHRRPPTRRGSSATLRRGCPRSFVHLRTVLVYGRCRRLEWRRC